MRLIIATAADATIINASQAYKHIQSELQTLSMEIYMLHNPLNEKQWVRLLEPSSEETMLLIDSHGAHDESVMRLLGIAAQQNWDVIPLVFSRETLSFFKLGTVNAGDLAPELGSHLELREDIEEIERQEKMRHLGNFMRLFTYWRVSGRANWENSLRFISEQYAGGTHTIAPPFEYPDLGIIDPITDTYYEDITNYMNASFYDATLPTVAFIYMSVKSRLDPTAVLQALIKKFKNKVNVLPIGLSSMMNVNAEKLMGLLKNSQMPVDLILNFMNFRLGSGPQGIATTVYTDLFKELNIPIIHPILIGSMEKHEWEQPHRTLGPSEQLVSIVLPELDGVIDAMPVAIMQSQGEDSEFNVQLKVLIPIENRINKMVNRVMNWLKLRRLTNENKKVAVIGYNYPIGEGNLFGGAYLDTFASIEKMLQLLHNEGYSVTPVTAEQLRAEMIENGLTNGSQWYSVNEEKAIYYPVHHYNEDITNSLWNFQIEKKWGKAPGNVLVKNEKFIIPGVINGNFFIGIQPPRAIQMDSETYHSGDIPPTHHYMAYYKWIQEVFQADVIIHIGTHGTLEFLPGKPVALSENCYSDALIGDIPHLYYYYLGNIAEAMIAKRRSSATLLTYQSPPFEDAELYAKYSDLHALIQEYVQAQQLDKQRAITILNLIWQLAEELSLPSESLDQLEQELYRMQTSFIPNGLHVFNKSFDKKAALDFTYKIVSMSRPNQQSLQQVIALKRGVCLEDLIKKNDIQALKKIDEEAKQLLVDFLFHSSEEMNQSVCEVLHYAQQVFEKLLCNHEEACLLNALNGGYIPAKPAGDVLRNPEILPTGYNMVQMDPSIIPSEAAMIRGREIAQNTIEAYIKEHGDFPQSIGIVLWGIETARTQGETIGQILHYVGARFVSVPHSFEKKIEIIPLNELNRPRINVFINASGIFRDMFSNLIDELSDLFTQISALDEPSSINYVKAQTDAIRSYYAGREEEKLANQLATGRIFAPALGEYDSGVTHVIHEGSWEADTEIGQLFATNRNYIYTKELKGVKLDLLYDQHAKQVEMISQIRSEFEHEVVDLDHYFEYFGGMSKAVENAKSEQVEIFISDSTKGLILTEKLSDSLERGVRTRLTNPKWIDGLLEHEYVGGQTIADRFKNVLGLAATTNAVKQWVFNDLHSVYVEDAKIALKLEQNNPYAYEEILRTMLVYNDRGYWQATEEQIEKIQEKYLELEASIE